MNLHNFWSWTMRTTDSPLAPMRVVGCEREVDLSTSEIAEKVSEVLEMSAHDRMRTLRDDRVNGCGSVRISWSDSGSVWSTYIHIGKGARMSDQHVCAEVTYGEGIHSDLCADSVDRLSDPEYSAFLHANLDEWLDRSNGTGGFYIGYTSCEFGAVSTLKTES